MFLKEDREYTTKGITVDGGNKQMDFISKEDSSSPTVKTEAMLPSCIIYSKEERCVTAIDIQNEFIQILFKNENETEVINIRGFLVDLILEIDP